MSKLNRRKLQRMILQEFKMMGMAPMQSMGKIGAFSQDDAEYMEEDAMLDAHTSDHTPMMGMGSMGSQPGILSGEDCCTAILSLIECCSCESTKSKIMAVCESILHGEDSEYYSS